MIADFFIPTAETVQHACKLYDEKYHLAESTLEELFRLFPKNDNLNHVLLKVVAVNALYHTCIFDLEEVARHIHAHHLAVDAALSTADPAAIDLIARLMVRSRTHNFYSFATKYANCHQPQAYPIYDSRIDSYLWNLQLRNRFSTFQHSDLCNYARFMEIMTDFRGFHGLKGFSFRQIDKFLHQHTEPVRLTQDGDNNAGPGSFDFFPGEEQAS